MKHALFAVRMLVFWTVAVVLFAGCSDDENTDTPDDGQSQDEPKTDGENKGDGDSLPQTGVVAPFAALAGLGASLLAGLGVKFGSRKDE